MFFYQFLTILNFLQISHKLSFFGPPKKFTGTKFSPAIGYEDQRALAQTIRHTFGHKQNLISSKLTVRILRKSDFRPATLTKSRKAPRAQGPRFRNYCRAAVAELPFSTSHFMIILDPGGVQFVVLEGFSFKILDFVHFRKFLTNCNFRVSQTYELFSAPRL